MPLSSFIRTLTVGSGFSPDLLTLFAERELENSANKRSRAFRNMPEYRRWGITPRPENKRSHYKSGVMGCQL